MSLLTETDATYRLDHPDESEGGICEGGGREREESERGKAEKAEREVTVKKHQKKKHQREVETDSFCERVL